ncbi:hypothetical protein [Streptomyces sp. HM190]|uniref:hypothetical protein n=1 Tax=Streptomyces sp. HM190 TaxID=2695266 RepID=UPI001357107E|nr:hypothetical protein [Streptomyces sp. HM190]
MTSTGKTVIIVLSAILAALVALAIAGFAFYASSDGESSGSDRRVGSAHSVTATWEETGS